MRELTREVILEVLRSVPHPQRGSDVVTLEMVSGIVIKGGNVGFALEVDPRDAAALEPLRRACEAAVKALPDVASVSAVLTAERSPSAAAPPPRSAGPRAGGAPAPQRPLVPDVAAIIAVASGKGGVGKSTTAVNLALGLAALGMRTGLLDADIYGPSLPRMLGVGGRPRASGGARMSPLRAWNIPVMSMGFLVEEDAPMIWRGPMVQSALQQMLGDVEWGALDVLVVDLPPGTGDAQLTMAQRVPLAGAVIVSTPQDIALLDARKAINMFRKVNVPILGIVENMSYFSCPNCGHRAEIFAHGGARTCAAQYGVDFLGEVPLEIAVRETSDAGRPIVVSEPESATAAIYRDLATRVRERLGVGAAGRPAPAITYD